MQTQQKKFDDPGEIHSAKINQFPYGHALVRMAAKSTKSFYG